MRTRDFKAFSAHVGLRVIGQAAYGTIGGFPVVMSLNQNAVQVTFTLENGAALACAKKIKRALRGVASIQMIDKEHLAVLLKERKVDLAYRYEAMTTAILDVFAENGIRPVEVCPLCKQAGCDSMGQVGAGYQAVHEACMRENRDAAQETAESNERNGSYLLGLLGGLLGGILACIPTVLTIWFAESAYTALYALIPLGVYYGYKLFRGKLNRGVIVITIVLSLLLAVSIDFAILSVALIQEGLPLVVLAELLSDSAFLTDMLSENLVSLVCVGVGILITWSLVSKTARSAVLGAEAALDTLMPLDTQRLADSAREKAPPVQHPDFDPFKQKL